MNAPRGRVVQVAAGGDHTCALLDDATVRCWGANIVGQVGDGTNDPRNVPTAVTGVTGIAAIALGEAHSCALAKDGTVRCWGFIAHPPPNAPGYSATAVTVPGLTGVVEIAADSDETCVRYEGGTVGCFECFSAVGPCKKSASVVRPIAGLDHATHIAVGHRWASNGSINPYPPACAIKSDGSVWCWTGKGPPVQIPNVAHATGLILARGTECASVPPLPEAERDTNPMHQFGKFVEGTPNELVGDGTVCWEWYDMLPENGRGMTAGAFLQVECMLISGRVMCHRDASFHIGYGWHPIAGLDHEASLAIGDKHACALRGDGTLRCFGESDFGQVGDGSAKQRSVPAKVPGVAGAARLVVGALGACAQTSDGTATCWGRVASVVNDAKGTAPREVRELDGARSISIGSNDVCAAAANGDVTCWGSDAEVAANGSVKGARSVASGDGAFCARDDGDVRCWGYSGWGPGGTIPSDPLQPLPPTPVPALAATREVRMSSGYACALAPGDLYCWGSTLYGRLGNGSYASSYSHPSPRPTRVLIDDPIAFALGTSHACAVKRDGGVACWGLNKYGEVGPHHDGPAGEVADMRGAPVAVATVSGAIGVAVSESASCAALASGKVRCWGGNEHGELGDGNDADQDKAIARGVDGAVEVGMGGDFACARTQTGDVYCWGDDQTGGLGDGRPRDAATPALIDFP